MPTSVDGTLTQRRAGLILRARWFAVSVPMFALGGGVMGAMGEVVGEALGGEFLHQFGHAVGTVLFVWLLVAAGGMVLHNPVLWMARWAIAGAGGALLGLLLYLPVLAVFPGPELTASLSFVLPLAAAVLVQAWALRGHLPGTGRWVAAWLLAILVATAVPWFAGGGVAGLPTAGDPYPILDKAVAYGWRLVPRSLVSGAVYAAWTAMAVPIPDARSSTSTQGRWAVQS